MLVSLGLRITPPSNDKDYRDNHRLCNPQACCYRYSRILCWIVYGDNRVGSKRTREKEQIRGDLCSKVRIVCTPNRAMLRSFPIELRWLPESFFSGITIIRNFRKDHGLRHRVALRNVVDNEGIEILYDLYSPIVLEIQVLRLQKRLDSDLRYLR